MKSIKCHVYNLLVMLLMKTWLLMVLTESFVNLSTMIGDIKPAKFPMILDRPISVPETQSRHIRQAH